MTKEGAARRWLEVAAQARIEEMTQQHRRQSVSETTPPKADEAAREDRRFKTEVRSAWALGDYDRFAALVWEVGPVVVAAAGIGPGDRVLDVAAGTGNTAIRAAEAGAEVIASDLTPEHFEAGRRRAKEHGVELEWMEADAEDLPFEDGSFDAVTSSFGAIFAPRHERVAAELVRVCKPGGRIAMANFTPEGLISDFFAVFLPYMPPPREGDLPPALWGSEEHVRDLLGSKVSSLEMTRKSYIERAESAEAYRDFFKETFGPVAAIYASLSGRPDDVAALDEAFLRFVEGSSQGPAGGPVALEYEYLLVKAVK